MSTRTWLFIVAFGIILAGSLNAAQDGAYTAKGKRDPFVPLITSSSKISSAVGLMGVETFEEISVEGLVLDADPKKSVIIVNGTVLREGDEVGSVKLLKIKANGADFSINGVDEFKPLYQEEPRKN